VADETAAPAQDSHAVTRLLQQWGSGDKATLDALMPLVYRQARPLKHSSSCAWRSAVSAAAACPA